jgi:hypothetical protein
MKLNSLLLLPAIIAVGIMPIVSISLFDAQPAFSQTSSPKQEAKDSILTPPPANRPVEKKRGFGFHRPGDGSGSGSGSGSGISVGQPSPEDALRLLCQSNAAHPPAECLQSPVPGGQNQGQNPSSIKNR